MKTFDEKCKILEKKGWGFLSGTYYGGGAYAAYEKAGKIAEVISANRSAVVYITNCEIDSWLGVKRGYIHCMNGALNTQGLPVYVKQIGLENPKIILFRYAFDALSHNGDWPKPTNSLINNLQDGEVVENNSGYVKVWREYIN